MGTFSVRAVESAVPPLLPPHKKEQYLANQQKQLMSDPSLRPSLEMFAAPDALEGEQNLVGFEDHDFVDPSTEATKEKEPQLRP
eukprot:CAMPEP_0202467040 /NCGR_PEP_ID=MMETSP1360-20130828/70714_1 /ASSEMBLY_ACC=CAM_ASM_000848 /TAXON_ID=515479 /ORGANISM="Licmophora paradoxa, Strain CCMP2313" /LENGTH=83 /DNA_ID=CAMNT_0049091393 /DNA_START=36 /DNA_END=283 /DNA_ORIENTATION=+